MARLHVQCLGTPKCVQKQQPPAVWCDNLPTNSKLLMLMLLLLLLLLVVLQGEHHQQGLVL